MMFDNDEQSEGECSVYDHSLEGLEKYRDNFQILLTEQYQELFKYKKKQHETIEMLKNDEQLELENAIPIMDKINENQIEEAYKILEGELD